MFTMQYVSMLVKIELLGKALELQSIISMYGCKEEHLENGLTYHILK